MMRDRLSFVALAILCSAMHLPVREPACQPDTAVAGDRIPRNVIVMIADGSGYSMLQATRLWTGEPLAMDGPEWTKLAQATYALRAGRAFRSDLEPLTQDPGMRYDPQRHYSTTPVFGELRARIGGREVTYPRGFAGYELHRRTAPDSAATASAMMAGLVTYNGAINFDGARRPAVSVAEVARKTGKRVGVVSNVAWTHATPACAGGAHNVGRENMHEISREILDAGVVDVLAGAGNPDYDANGHPRAQPDYMFYAPDDWQQLKEGERTDAGGQRWTLVQDTEAIRTLAATAPPERLVVMPRVGPTLQQRRAPADRNGDGRRNLADLFQSAPGEDPPNANLPTLTDLTGAALNAIDDDEDGFFLMVEGGAVDWAMHDNQLGRAIEEYIEFNAAIQYVISYLDANTNGHNWQNTLVIVTSDHDHLLYGPEADTIPFQELEDRGPGNIPGHRWFSNGHSNHLVPLFARGLGSTRLIELADEIDAWNNGSQAFGRGPYLHQAELGALLKKYVAGPTGAGEMSPFAADQPAR